ncbi:MAG: hypothetical protein ACI4V7_02035 [Succinivibrionaceae bacterium]
MDRGNSKIIIGIISVLISLCIIATNISNFKTPITYISFKVKTSLTEENVFKVIYTDTNEKSIKDSGHIISTSVNTNNNEWTHVKIKVPLVASGDSETTLYNLTFVLSENRGYKEKDETSNRILIKDLNIGSTNLIALKDGDFKSLNDLEFIGFRFGENRFTLKAPALNSYFTLNNNITPTFEEELNYYSLFIVLFITISLIYMILRILVNIRLYQSVSTANLTFIIMVIITLFYPSWNIDKSDTSLQEKRKLAPFKGIFSNGSFNENFGKDFEAWFNDRFNGRSKAIFTNNEIKLRINKILQANNCVRNKDWIYNNYEMDLTFDENLVYRNKENLEKLSKLFNQKLYVLVYPYGPVIYKDINIRNTINNDTKLIANELNNSELLTAIDVSEIFEKELKNVNSNNTENLLYYKDEHHATEYAHWLTIKYLIDNNYLSFNNKEPESNIINCATGEFRRPCKLYGQTYGIIFGENSRDYESDIFNLTPYKIYSKTLNYDKCITARKPIEEIEDGYELTNSCINDNNTKIAVVGNSFVENLSMVLATKSKSVLRLRGFSGSGQHGYVEELEESIKKYSPDIILVAYYQDEFSYLRYKNK